MSLPDDAFDPPIDTGGQLRVTPAGSSVVATDALLASADRLRGLELALHEDGRRLVAAHALDGWPVPDFLLPRLERVRERCAAARDAFGRAAEEYTRVEALVEGAQRDLAALVAALVGPMAFGVLARMIASTPGLLIAGALLGWAAIPDGGDGRLGTVKQFLLDNPELITSPEFVRLVSHLATSIDAAALGLAGVPPLLAAAFDLGPDGGVAAGAVTVAALGALIGMFRETPVAVEAVRSTPIAAAPEGARQRMNEIPEGDQIRIEKYEADGMPPRFVVYIGPTETFSPFAGREPFDLTSNVVGVAGLDPASFRAVELAMEQAGVTAGDEIVVSGFSQGGLIATMVAGSRDWNVYGLETYGAPAGNIPLPDGIHGFAARNTDDFIPALAGPQLDHSVMQIEREAYRAGTEMPTALPAPAHQRFAYGHLADAIDGAEARTVRTEVRLIDAFAAEYLDLPGGRGTSTTYRAVRIESP
jgi:hypothetical protein